MLDTDGSSPLVNQAVQHSGERALLIDKVFGMVGGRLKSKEWTYVSQR